MVCVLLFLINLFCIFLGNIERVNEIFCSCVKCKRNFRNNVGIEKKFIILVFDWFFWLKKNLEFVFVW